MDTNLLYGLTPEQLVEYREKLIDELLSARHSWSEGGSQFTARSPHHIEAMLDAVQKRLAALGVEDAPPRRHRVGQIIVGQQWRP